MKRKNRKVVPMVAPDFRPLVPPSEMLCTKLEFAQAWQRSVRWVDEQLANGLPHLKLAERNGGVRIPLQEANAYLKEKLRTVRRGPGDRGNLPALRKSKRGAA